MTKVKSLVIATLTEEELQWFKDFRVEESALNRATEAAMRGIKSLAKDIVQRKSEAFEKLNEKYGIEANVRYSIDRKTGNINKDVWQ